MSDAPKPRLARLVYAYTAVCVVGAVAVFLAVATWHYSLRQPPPGRPPDTARDVGRPPPPPRDAPPPRRPPPPRPPSPRPPGDVLFLVGGILLVLVSVGSLWFARRLTRPLHALERAARAYGEGDRSARANLDGDDEIAAVGRAFDDMAERTTRLIEAQNELMANVSHELRTPLARMRVALDTAQENPALADTPLVTGLDGDVADLESLVGDVLASLRVAMTAGLESLETIDVRDAIAELARRFERNHPDRTLAVEVPDRPLCCRAEPQLLQRAVENLLDNACKYSEQEIALRARARDGAIAIEVEDRGAGIPREDLERVFEPFFRADRSRHRGTGGVGLGLHLVRGIASAHGGDVAIDSEPGRGTTVTLRIPTAPGA